MTTFRHASRLAACVTFSALIAVGACGKDKGTVADTSSSAAATATPPAAAPASTAPLAVADIDAGRHIGADKKIADKTDDFAPGDTIYATVHTTGTANNSTIVGRWTFGSGTPVDERSETISPTGDAYTEFHISKPGGWPKGKYTLHVLIDGKEVQTKDVTVK